MAIAAASLFFLAGPAEANTEPLPIVGTVYDTNGSTPVAGATVIIRDQETGAWGMNVTDGSGHYEITLGGLDRPWTAWFEGDLLVGTAYYMGQTGKNTTTVGSSMVMGPYGPEGYEWMNITLGTPVTTKTIGTPQFTKYDFDTGNSTMGYLVSENISITSVSATLSFWTWWQIESWSPSSYDLNVSISTDGGYTWHTLDTLNPDSNPGDASDYSYYGSSGFNTAPQWVYHQYDISAYVPNDIRIMFKFDSRDNLYNYWEGWCVDDISVGGFSDNVENGVGNWTYTGLWHISDHRSRSSSHCWYYGTEHSYVSSSTPFTMTATGNYNDIWYDIWNGTWSGWTAYTGPFTLGPEEGMRHLQFYAENGSNSEPVQNQSHCVDNSPPTSTYAFQEPTAVTHHPSGNYTTLRMHDPANDVNGSIMWINATDNATNCGAGVKWLNYSIWWNANQPANYVRIRNVQVRDNGPRDLDKRVGFISVALRFEEECFHEVKWRMVDYLGHRSPEYSIDIAVDGTAPDIDKIIGGPSYVDENDWTWVNCSTPFWINVTDDGCYGGVGVYQFGINVFWNETRVPAEDLQQFELIRTIVVTDGGENDSDGEVNGEISYKFTFDRDCFHEPEFWAIDYVGNYYTFKEKDMVDCTPPAVYKNISKVVALEQTEIN
ncbi:MAG: hypothetical protein ACP5EK_04490, partial [Thermoplasmatota archaeon]